MPMPRLLKRLSRKSLKDSESTRSPPDLRSEPPLPVRTSAFTNGNGSSSYLPPAAPYLDRPTPPTPQTPITPNDQLLPSPPTAVLQPLPPVPQDDFLKNLQGPWASVTADPKTSKGDKVLQKIENGGVDAMGKEAQGAAILAGVKTGLDTVGATESLEKDLNSFADGMPILMKVLDEVGKIHPFIQVAVLAFKAVWALEQKRRDNDRKILVLHMKMKEMMEVLIQLQDITDPTLRGPNGLTIEGRMQVIVAGTAKDIEACGNTCDTYSKKKLVVKVLKGPIWDGKLGRFVEIFMTRRAELDSALVAHTALGVDAAKKTLKTVDQTTQEVKAQMAIMMQMLQSLISPKQKEMARMIEQRWGPAYVDDEDTLRELNAFETKSGGSQEHSSSHGGKSAKPAELEAIKALKEELHTDPDLAIDRNMTKFARKFEVQQRQLLEEVDHMVKREGDRVIGALTAGPHERILDPDVHMVWKDMGWRGSVKVRHFVMALRDHFQEDHKRTDGQPQGLHDHVVDKADEWALEYIDVVRLQQISEAFDDDNSGFVTVAEVNAFTSDSMRPLKWSLPHWLAYWAAGHHQTMQVYATRINETLAKMFSMLPHIDPINKSSATNYLEAVDAAVYTLTASLDPCYVNESLQERFATCVVAEEARIRANLEAVDYDIDASDTLVLVTGKGRIDRFVLPLVALLLERHLEIFRICQEKRIVHPDELWDAADTLDWVLDAVHKRVKLLQTTFKQQKLDLKQQFRSFSHGLYEYSNEPDLLWSPQRVREAQFVQYTYDDSLKAHDVDIGKILNYLIDQEPLDLDAYARPKERKDFVSTSSTHVLQGQWHGHVYRPTSQWPSSGMISLFLEPSFTEGELQYFTAADRANGSDFKIAGECRAGDDPNILLISFERSFPARFPSQYYTGTWNTTTETLSGTVGFEKDPQTHPVIFVFKRTITPEHLCFFPAPVALETNKARALWGFAIAAVTHNVRRDRWAWAFFKQRRDIRRRFIELYIRDTRFGTPLTALEDEESWQLLKSMTAADSRFYHSLAKQKIRATPEHSASCDNCKGSIGGARIICLVCQSEADFNNTVDFCETPCCITDRFMRYDLKKAHQPHHDLLKVRRVVHLREFGNIYRNAKEALKQARTLLPPALSTVTDSGSGSGTQGENENLPPAAKRLSQIPILEISIPQAIIFQGPPSGQPTSAMSLSKQVPNPGQKAPLCCRCSKPVTQPCWYCVQCAGTSFICWDCDSKGEVEVEFANHRFHSHDLVRVQDLVEEKDLTMEERFTELEERFSKHEKAMDQRLERIESAVDGRMARMEKMMEDLLNRAH
ncbi:hypothetical protein B0H17DRAFT_1336028 [Mycena rosella]|uniref:Vacuolar protein sorting-associated protein 13 second N-terminal domain-containing protein n=1 Tax=Mycena rosella TaxID=1033263 RepID=A0AAD7CXB7_MYCRO|nr:hypothetical protein B0H17DRAFT_1336028 [Mycena rosella]